MLALILCSFFDAFDTIFVWPVFAIFKVAENLAKTHNIQKLLLNC